MLVTNNFKLGATTIAVIYKERWQIEIFLKALKQNFCGNQPQRVKIQIWTALIAIRIPFGLTLPLLPKT